MLRVKKDVYIYNKNKAGIYKRKRLFIVPLKIPLKIFSNIEIGMIMFVYLCY